MMFRITRAQCTVALHCIGLALAAAILVTVPLLQSAKAASDDWYRVTSGVAVYLGLQPAELIKGHPKGHPESTMHGGKPGGLHEYHLIAAVFDEQTGARIETASVQARASGVGLANTNVALEPMSMANTITYGNFVKLPDDLYTIRITVGRPGIAEPVALDFAFDHRLRTRR